MNISTILQATFRDPRQAFRQAVALELPTSALWQALLLTVVVGVIITTVGLLLDPTELPLALAFMANPLVNAAMQATFITLFTLILHAILRMAGGANRLDDVVLAVAWVQAILCLFSAAQIVLLLVSPLLAAILGLISFIVFVWLMVAFVTEAGRFPTSFKPFWIIAVSLTIAGLFAGILMLLSGAVDPMEFANA